MTIKEAVILYQQKTDKIEKVKSLLNHVAEYNQNYMKDPLGGYRMGEDEFKQLHTMLQDYIGYLNDELNAVFPQ